MYFMRLCKILQTCLAHEVKKLILVLFVSVRYSVKQQDFINNVYESNNNYLIFDLELDFWKEWFWNSHGVTNNNTFTRRKIVQINSNAIWVLIRETKGTEKSETKLIKSFFKKKQISIKYFFQICSFWPYSHEIFKVIFKRKMVFFGTFWWLGMLL